MTFGENFPNKVREIHAQAQECSLLNRLASWEWPPIREWLSLLIEPLVWESEKSHHLLPAFIALCYNTNRPGSRVAPLGRGAMVAQRTLDPYILVRIRAPQPELPLRVLQVSKVSVSDGPRPGKFTERSSLFF